MLDQTIKNKIEKVVVNVGTGRLSQASDFESKILPELTAELSLLTGQKPQIIRSQRAIAGFKLKLNQVIGLKTTLRGTRAFDFLERLINIVLPRIKDFRGLPAKSIDKSGVLNIGLRDQVIFPEIVPENSRVSFGLEVTIIPKTRRRSEAIDLYKSMRVPIKYG